MEGMGGGKRWELELVCEMKKECLFSSLKNKINYKNYKLKKNLSFRRFFTLLNKNCCSSASQGGSLVKNKCREGGDAQAPSEPSQ